MGERGGVARGVGQVVTAVHTGLNRKKVVLLSPCDAYRRFQSESMLVARPTNVLNTEY